MGEALAHLERSSTIVEVDEFVLARACRRWRDWQDALGARWPLGLLSINISSFHFQQRDFADRLRRAIEESGVAPERLALEVTETAFVDDEAAFERSIRAAALLGVSIWVDDFGAGSASLALLRKGWASVVKLDRELAAPRRYDAATVATIRAIARLARELDVRTIAEGVETPEQAARLTELGCDFQQGYLHARPMPADALERWARKAAETSRPAPRRWFES